MAELIVLPKIGVNMVEATIQTWLVDVGAPVNEGEPLLEAETDKSTQEIYSPATGTILAHLVPAGTTVECQTAIAVIGEAGEDFSHLLGEGGASVDTETAETAADEPARPQTGDSAGGGGVPPASVPAGGRIRISPLARRIARDHGIDIAVLTPAEPGARITKEDVLTYLSTEPEEVPRPKVVAGSTTGGERRTPMTRIRKVIARRLTESAQTIPRAVLNVRVDATGLLEWKDVSRKQGQKLGITGMIIRALANALPDHPLLNSRLDGEEIVTTDVVNVGVAVDSNEGLMVPVLHNANGRTAREIGRELEILVGKARSGKLEAADVEGGTFTITNLGMLGIEQFIPVINPPQCAILAVGAITREVIPLDTGDGTRTRSVFWMSLAFDHRIVDGAPAGRFLQDLKSLLEHPVGMVE